MTNTSGGLSDNSLWENVKLGDIKSYELLFRQYYPALCIFAKKYTNDLTTAREIIQDLFIHLWEHRERLRINTSFKAYIYQAARFNSIRRIENARLSNITLDEIPEPESEFYDFMEYAELQEQILKAIESLPPQCNKIFKLSRFEQLTYIQIAKQLNLSVKTIEAQISKALRIIQHSIEGYLFLLIYFFTSL